MAESSDEEMDYMSESFVNIPESKDIRPSLIKNRTAKRQIEMEKAQGVANQKSRVVPKRVLEEQQRTEALNTPITSNNIGFSMMQKMGFQPGMALGKEGTSGLTQPIPVVLKSDRQGLGRETELKRKIERDVENIGRRKRLRQQQEEELQTEFRKRIISSKDDKKMQASLKKAQKACEYLDSQKGLWEPEEHYFWPDEASSLGYHENYGEQGDEDDTDDTGRDRMEASDTEGEEEEEEENEIEELEPREKLQQVVAYLRSKHRYCVWCATVFNDEEDMSANCPGLYAEDHDE